MLSPNSIYIDLEKLIEQYISKLETYSPQEFAHKTDESTWSLGQMYEHLIISNSFFYYQINNCFSQRKGQIGGDKNPTGENMYQYGSFPPIKIKIPEAWKGPEPIAKAKQEYTKLLQTELEKLNLLITPLQNDSGEYKTFHAACGMLNALEWYKMAEMHLKHHLKQASELETLFSS